MPLTIYKSSAGSGKTFTLVKEYVKLVVEQPSDYKHILAITFTNKATEEMKHRILSALSGLAKGGERKLYDILREELHADIDIVDNAQKALNYILHNYGDFAVSTIDSFFQKIIRSFAKELNLPIGYEVELDQSLMLDYIINTLLEQINQQGKHELSEWLMSFALQKIEEDKGWNIESSIRKIGQEIFKEKIHSITAFENFDFPFLGNVVATIKTFQEDYEEKLVNYGEEAIEFVESNNLDRKDFNNTAINFFYKLQKKDFNNLLNTTVEKIADGDIEKWVPKSRERRVQAMQLVNAGLHDIFLEAYNLIQSHEKTYHTFKLIWQEIYSYGLIKALLDEMRSMRDSNKQFFITDTGPMLDKIVSEQDSPFVYEKVGNRYRHILIDEFQDTSSLQWSNIRPLLVNSLAADHQALVVGDVKQSIYRWRGGNMQLLLEGVEKELKPFITPESKQELRKNYRSLEHIVAFNNLFFETATSLLEEDLKAIKSRTIKKSYDSVTQEILPDKMGKGYVECRFLEELKAEEGATEDPPTYKELVLENLLSIIKQTQADGYALDDVAILVRYNGIGIEITDFLNEHNIQVISAESLLLKNATKIQLLVALLRYLYDERNQIAQAGALYHYRKLHEKGDDNHYDDVFKDHLIADKDRLFFEEFPFLDGEEKRDALIRLPLYELVEMLIQLLQLDEEADAYIQTFQDNILGLTSKRNADILGFLTWWDDHGNSNKAAINIPEGENAVKIFSIHRAKGLQFPVVIIPFANWSMQPKSGKQIVWAEPSERAKPEEIFDHLNPFPVPYTQGLGNSHFRLSYEYELMMSIVDNLNLLYVACTRPKERLYILSEWKKDVKKSATSPIRIKDIHSLLKEVLDQPNFKEYWLDDDRTVVYGIEQAAGPKKSDSKKIIFEKLERYDSNDYREKEQLQIRRESGEFFILFDNKQADAIKRGIQLHEILAKMEQPSDLDMVLNRLYAEGKIKQRERASLTKEVNALFEEVPEMREWFSSKWEVIAERRILKENEVAIPDRVLVNDHRALIIDYKTGQQEDKYKYQLRKYEGLLKEMGYQDIEMYLFYIDDKAVVQVK